MKEAFCAECGGRVDCFYGHVWRGATITPGWQPIETAPKDGRAVLIAAVDGTDDIIRIANWNQQHNAWITDAGFPSPTHWMPLPAPPEDSK